MQLERELPVTCADLEDAQGTVDESEPLAPGHDTKRRQRIDEATRRTGCRGRNQRRLDIRSATRRWPRGNVFGHVPADHLVCGHRICPLGCDVGDLGAVGQGVSEPAAHHQHVVELGQVAPTGEDLGPELGGMIRRIGTACVGQTAVVDGLQLGQRKRHRHSVRRSVATRPTRSPHRYPTLTAAHDDSSRAGRPTSARARWRTSSR